MRKDRRQIFQKPGVWLLCLGNVCEKWLLCFARRPFSLVCSDMCPKCSCLGLSGADGVFLDVCVERGRGEAGKDAYAFSVGVKTVLWVYRDSHGIPESGFVLGVQGKKIALH